MDRHDNPYTPGAGVKPPALVGRDDDIEDFRVALARLGRGTHSRSFVFDGLRGVGKTVLLNELDVVAREAGWITSGVVECNEDDALAPLIAQLAHRALRKLSRGKRISKTVRTALGALKAFTLTMDQEGRWRFNIDVDAATGIADSGNLADDIVELLAEVGRASAESGAGVLLALDEMQFLDRRELALLATAMHRVSQENMPVLLVGAGLPQLPLMLSEAKPYTERLFDYRTIGSLSRAQAASALTIPARRGGARYAPDALEMILDESAGYPHFLQQWGEAVWREAETSTITVEDAGVAEELVHDELDRRFFRDRYDRATEAEKIYMAAIADLGDGPHSSASIAQRMGKRQKDVSVRRAGLLKKGLVFNPVDTDLDFTVPHFARYIRRVHPFDPAERPSRGRRPAARDG
jgi:hypothetical protein